MKQSQKLALKLSETRQKINELLAIDEAQLTDEQRGELSTLTAEYPQTEERYRAALIAEETGEAQDGDGEAREYAELEGRSSVGEIFAGALGLGNVEGATAELQQELGLHPNQVPLALIRERQAASAEGVEARAVTPAPANVGTNQGEIIPAVFPLGAAAFLGVDMPTVGVGEAVYPVLTNQDAAGSADEGANVAETTGAFSADVLQPRRIQASFFYSREDAAKFAGMDAALRQNLNDALTSGLDKEVLTKTGEGLLDFGADPAAPGGESSFAAYRAAIYDAVDGRYAGDAMAVRLLLGPASYRHASTKYRGNNADDSALDSIQRVSGGVRTSAHVPAVANKVQDAVAARGMLRHCVAPIWEGVTIIPDEVTKAATGEIVLTAVMLHAVKVIRAGGFRRVRFQVAA